MSRRAVFLDRDGVLNRESDAFIKTPDELHVFHGVPEAVALLNTAGYLAVVISNQSGLARGLVTPENLEAIHAKLREEIAAAGGRLDGIYHCPHLPGDGCACRKPATGMITQAAADLDIDLAASWLVGDRPEDIACGAAAGCRTVFVLTGKSAAYDSARFNAPPAYVASALPAAVEIILAD